MKTLGTLQITIVALDPTTSMLSWELIQEWMKETDGWDGWTEERVDEYNAKRLEALERGEMQLLGRVEAYDVAVPADLFSAQGWTKEHHGATVAWKSPWFKPDGTDEIADQMVDVLCKALQPLKGGGYRKLCEKEAK